MGRREGYAKPVAIASFSMDPATINWLNGYAHEHKTSKSWIIRTAIQDFKDKIELNTKVMCTKCGAKNDASMAKLGCWQCEEPLNV